MPTGNSRESRPAKLPKMPQIRGMAWLAKRRDSPCWRKKSTMDTPQVMSVNQAKRLQGTPPGNSIAIPRSTKRTVRTRETAPSTSAPQISLAAYSRPGVVAVSSSLRVAPLCSISQFRLARTAVPRGNRMASTIAKLYRVSIQPWSRSSGS